MDNSEYIEPVQQWVETVVIGLNLCPFAKREWVRNRVRFAVSLATTEVQLLADLQAEFEQLNISDETETTLLIHPHVLQDFYDYNDFIFSANELIDKMKLEGVYQVASFHPDYQFEGTEPEDAENYSNKAPFPMLHLIREESLEQAIANYPDTDLIPERNIALLNKMGRNKMQALLTACLERK